MKKEIKIIEKLTEIYGERDDFLNYTTPFELVVAVMLSAQCTDKRVNMVTEKMFKVANTPQQFAKMSVEEIEGMISSISYFHTKARHIKECSEQIVKDFDGKVPNNMEDLMKLSGIGRKSANVIMLEAFGIALGVAVDTHAKRLSNRIGLSSETEPEKIEKDLIRIFPKKYLKDVNHLLVWHGRNCCTARNPKCDKCPIKNLCEYRQKNA